MTLEENLEFGAIGRRGSYGDDMERMYETFPILKERRKQIADNLTGGE